MPGRTEDGDRIRTTMCTGEKGAAMPIPREPSVIRDVVWKLVIVAVAVLLGLTWLGRLTWLQALNAAVWVTLVTYVIGDLIVLRWAGPSWASFANFLVGALTIWLVTLGMRSHPPLWTIWFTAVLLGAGEHLYHLYLERVGYPVREEDDKTADDT